MLYSWVNPLFEWPFSSSQSVRLPGRVPKLPRSMGYELDQVIGAKFIGWLDGWLIHWRSKFHQQPPATQPPYVT